jgi:hypothetical protein
MPPDGRLNDSLDARTHDRCCIGCGHPLRGVTRKVCPECGRRFDPDLPRTMGKVANLGFRRGLIGTCRVLHWAFLIFAVTIILYSGLGGHWILVAMIVFASLPIMLLQFILLALPMQPISVQRRLLGYLVPLAVISVPLTDWPIRMNFELHEASLQAVADRVASGETFPRGTRVGILRFRQIRKARTREHIGFQINGGGHGGMFFVATPPEFVGRPSSYQPLRNLGNVWDNTNWTVDLGNGWYLVEQD